MSKTHRFEPDLDAKPKRQLSWQEERDCFEDDEVFEIPIDTDYYPCHTLE